jgi:hypothetical protein
MKSFPQSWIQPGEFSWCYRCGEYLTWSKDEPDNSNWCGYCKYRIDIDDMLCGICGLPAVMWFIHGARCDEHSFQENPTDQVLGKITFTIIKIRSNFPFEEAEKAKQQTVEIHNRLKQAMIDLATNRKDLPPLFWMNKPCIT